MPLNTDQTRQKANSLTSVILGLYPVLLYPARLARTCILPLLSSQRLLVRFTCLCLFPVFIFTTLISSLLGIIINHMVHNSTASSSSGDSSNSPTFRHSTTAPSTPSSHHSMDEDDQDDLGYWVQRCSICFDAQLDLCLEYCRDQYCLDCFRRLVTCRFIYIYMCVCVSLT